MHLKYNLKTLFLTVIKHFTVMFFCWIRKRCKFSQLTDIILIHELGHGNLLYTLHVFRKANFLLSYSFIHTLELHFLSYLPMFGFTASDNLKPTCSRSNICKSSSMSLKSFRNIWGPNFTLDRFVRRWKISVNKSVKRFSFFMFHFWLWLSILVF